MYLILCWSYLNHSLRFVGEKKRIKKNRILNRNILVKNRNSIIFPNRSALEDVLLPHAHAHTQNSSGIFITIYNTHSHTHTSDRRKATVCARAHTHTHT